MTLKYYANRITGLSGDTKPTNVEVDKIFFETDTNKSFIFQSGSWTELSSSVPSEVNIFTTATTWNPTSQTGNKQIFAQMSNDTGVIDVNVDGSFYTRFRRTGNNTAYVSPASSLSLISKSLTYDVLGTKYATGVPSSGSYPQMYDNGTKAYTVGGTTMYQWDLSTAYDITSYSLVRSQGFQLGSNGSFAVYDWSEDGLYMVAHGNNANALKIFTMSTAWDISTATETSSGTTTAGINNTARSVQFADDGLGVIVVSDVSWLANYFILTTPYSFSGSGGATYFDMRTTEAPSAFLIKVHDSGNKMLIWDNTSNTIFRYTLSTPYNPTTKTYTNDFIDCSSTSLLGSTINNTIKSDIISGSNAFVQFGENWGGTAKATILDL